jgi:hypothetical protein
MPREQINYAEGLINVLDPETGELTEDAATFVGCEEPILNVRWQGDTEDAKAHVLVSLEVTTRTACDAVANAGPDGVAEIESVQLDRRQINKMIRALRRARDTAFGSDE